MQITLTKEVYDLMIKALGEVQGRIFRASW